MLYHKRGKRQRTSLQQILLRAIATEGSLTLIRVIEHGAELLRYASGNTLRSHPEYNLSRAAIRLIEKGYLTHKGSGVQSKLMLTRSGQNIVDRMKYGDVELQTPKRWDGKWHLIIYDIKEEQKKLRVELKETLRGLGFVAIQKSVWVYPYPCNELLTILKVDFRVGSEVLYVVVDKLENDLWLKQHFKLRLS